MPTRDLHVAVIPDGNRRYGQRHADGAADGHEEGTETAVGLLDWLDDFPEVGRLTLWGLSNANAERRPRYEIDHLNDLYREYAEDLAGEDSRVHASDVRVEVVGDRELLRADARGALERLEEETRGYDRVELGAALGYSAAWDTRQAVESAEEAYGDGTRYEEFLAMPEVDVLMGYGPDRAHLSGFVPQERMVDATVYLVNHHNPDEEAYWPEARREHLEDALEMHADRSHTRGS